MEKGERVKQKAMVNQPYKEITFFFFLIFLPCFVSSIGFFHFSYFFF